MRGFKLRSIFCVFLVLFGASEGATLEKVPIIERPADHMWDRDDLFRNNREEYRELSQGLIALKEETGMEVYLVTYYSIIGEDGVSLADRCHDKWLGDESDGLVLVLGFNDMVLGDIGRSKKLYDGHFIEENLMPRISYVNLETVIKGSSDKLRGNKTNVDSIMDFTSCIMEGLRDHILAKKQEKGMSEIYYFFTWMVLILLVGGGLFLFFVKALHLVEHREQRVYEFPDFKVAHRLNGRCGGGKISIVEFEIPPFSDVL